MVTIANSSSAVTPGLWSTSSELVGAGGTLGVPARPVSSPGGESESANPPGSSIRHMCPRVAAPPGDFLVSIARGGNRARVTEVGRPRPGRGGTRGKVKGFSRSSRCNMLDLVHSVDRRGVLVTFFATLTVPRGEGDWSVMERHRRTWMKRFEREFPGRAFVVWKKELHKSGTVHLHALIFWVVDPPRLVEFRAWNDDAWADTVKSPNPWHRKVGCRVEIMRGWNGVGHYCAKYLAKDQDGLRADTGRIWGVHNRKLLPVTNDVQHVPRAVGIKARRVLRHLQKRRREKWFIRSADGLSLIRPGPGLSVLDQVATARAAGLTVKRSRPRCCVTVDVQVWGQVEGSHRVEPLQVERHTYSPALHFVGEAETRRVLMWAMDRWLAELVGPEDDLPV